MTDIGLALATGMVHIVVVIILVAPFVWWTARRRGERALASGAWPTVFLAAGIYLAAMVILDLPRVGVFADLMWNWQNKALLFLLLLAFIALWPGLSFREVGFTKPAPRWWLPVLIATVAIFALQLVIGPLGVMEPTGETVAYQATIPGLDEEVLFRGVLVLLLGRVLLARRPIWGGQVGWATGTVVTLLFGLGHGLRVEPGLVVSFDFASVLFTGLLGLLLLWARIRTRSLWPAILLHNTINSSVVAANAVSG